MSHNQSLPSQSHVESLVDAAVQKRLHTKNAELDASNRLLGECAENAAVLLDILNDNGIEGELAVGAMDIPGEPIPDSPREAIDLGLIHYWVEVPTQGSVVMCELASERPQNPELAGGPTVSESPPAGLIDFGERYSVRDIRTGECPADNVVLWDAIRAARDATLASWNIDETESECLRGYCHEHAAEVLRETVSRWQGNSYRGYSRGDAVIQFGAATSATGCSLTKANTTTTVSEVLEKGGDHYWVNTPFTTPETPGFTLDMWALTETEQGQPIVRRGTPNEYVPDPDATVGQQRILTDETWYHAHMTI
ncbi:hypothetical protein [Salinibaculum rarum]|uniref:hypothetical protein n=1 Tax=Salinibaculum rarum TaxID=3058903 RepID=UPI00265DD830|nr:hypothetical protein [Salinibaculum sp. KK48]